jgi:Uma2 family endonuclease
MRAAFLRGTGAAAIQTKRLRVVAAGEPARDQTLADMSATPATRCSRTLPILGRGGTSGGRVAIEPRLMSADDLLRLPADGMRHELVDGELRTMAPAGGPHGRDALRIGARLLAHVEAHGLGEVLAAETGFLLRRDPDLVRAGDVAFVRADRLPAPGLPAGYVPLSPDLVVEVVSPNDSAADVQDKVDTWLRFGTQAVWVLYPGPRLMIHHPDGTARALGADDEIDGGAVLPGFRLRLRDLLGARS